MADLKREYKILLDTNFLVDLARFKIDLNALADLLDEKCRMLVPEAVRTELGKIKSKYGRVALKLVELYCIETIEYDSACKKTDDKIVDMALNLGKESKVLVATNDAKLRERLKALGVKTIYLRARKHLEIS
jgi:rRNA-processing protein FCF1